MPAGGDLGGGQSLAGAGRAGKGRRRGGVDADISGEAAQIAAAFGPADGRQDERGDDLLQHLTLVGMAEVVVLPSGGEVLGLVLRQTGAPVVAGRIQHGGEPIERAIEASGSGKMPESSSRRA
ncbi:hypothetical protein [Nonomuraea jabiensis]|uniref:hypothetical protein n=1 Tax=Nonomuraea jabiensis TaxID=882448 RepID=UPI003D737DE1